MLPSSAPTMPKPKTTGGAPPKPETSATEPSRGGRPRGPTPPAVTIAVRVKPETLAALDVAVEHRKGPRTNRSALVAFIIEEWLEANPPPPVGRA